MDNQKIMGIDIGATKIHIGIVQDGNIINEVKLPTSSQAPEGQVIAEIISGIGQLIEPDVTGIGIGVPGLVDEENGIVHDVQNIPSWKEVHLKNHLEAHFKKTVYITNDANTFVLGEKIYGKAKKFKNVIGITLGTGFGTGIVIDNKLYSGTLSSAGELGGIPYQGQTIEDYCSGKFFLDKFGIQGSDVFAMAKGGNDHALEIFNQYGAHLGNVIKIILYTFSPQAIFLGGSVSGCYSFFKEAMQAQIQSFPFKLVTEKLIVEPSEIANVAVLGAAALYKMKSEGA
jgi:glucokinase